MYKFLVALCIFGLASFGIAIADDMDGGSVVRDEHVARAAGGGEEPSAAPASGHARASRDEGDVPEAEHGQDLMQLRAAREGRSMPSTLELDSLGMYFGLGEHFVDMANSLIDERAGYYNEHGSTPVYSRLSDGPRDDLHATRDDARTSDSHQRGQDSAGSGDDAAAEGEGLNRRGADYDYFWD